MMKFFRCSSWIRFSIFPSSFQIPCSIRRRLITGSEFSNMSDGLNSSPETFSFLCQRQMVKVDSSIHHLDRLKSSLKSGYFEKIFTSGDFEAKHDQVFEIQPKNKEVFPIIVELIHGKKLMDVLKNDNYVSLLETMVQLEMEIDRSTVNNFINHNLMPYSPQDAKIFELYNFIAENSEFEDILNSVFVYFSNYLMAVRSHEIFPSLQLDHLIRIINNVENPNDDDRYEIVQMCTDWLSHDMENRLPHMATLINSIISRFQSGGEIDEDNSALSNRFFKTSIDEQSKQIMAKCVFAMLAYGEIPFDGMKSDDEWEFRCNSNYCESSDYESEREGHILSTCFTITTEEKAKLGKFLKNGDLYDITVRVGKKTYKLHRLMLELKSEYFANIFRAEYAEAVVQRDGIPTCPNKLEEYSLGDEIDQSTFDAVINYIYFNNDIGYEFNVNFGILKTADILKIHDLLERSKSWFKHNAEEVGSQDAIEILNFTQGRIEHHDLYILYLCKHLKDKWPKIDNMLQFCSISFDMLAEVIRSSRFRLDNPLKILDICSKWICHNVENRYRMLPRLARTINDFCVVNCDKFETINAQDLRYCSEQMVRDKLWEILSSISYMLPDEVSSNKSTKKFEEIPVFIASSNNKEIDVLNANLDEIGSFEIQKSTSFSIENTSTTMINNCLFLLCNKGDPPIFQVYNLSSKKRFVLASNRAVKRRNLLSFESCDFTVLNCNNEIYYCSKDGLVMKYSMQLNRWMILSQHESKKKVCFTSDGNKLYRMHAVSENKDSSIRFSNYVVEGFDTEKKLWNCVPGLPELKRVIANVSQLTVFNGCDLAASTFADIYLFDRETKKWCECSIPQDLWQGYVLFAHCEDEMFLVIDKKLYNFTPSNGSAELKKELPSKYAPRYFGYKYGNIAFIHRPIVETEHH